MENESYSSSYQTSFDAAATAAADGAITRETLSMCGKLKDR